MPVSNQCRVRSLLALCCLHRTLPLGPPVKMAQTGEMSVCVLSQLHARWQLKDWDWDIFLRIFCVRPSGRWSWKGLLEEECEVKALESTVRSHRFNLNLLKPCEFGRLSFQVHLAETPRHQRERNLLFTWFQVEQDNFFWQPFGVPEMCNDVRRSACPYPLGESSASAVNFQSLNHAQNKRMLFKRSWRVLTIAFSSCSSASSFNKGLQCMFCFQKNRFPFTIRKATIDLGGKKKNVCKYDCFLQPVSYAAFLRSWHCFDTYMWVFNMLIKCLVPHRHWPLLALTWKFPEEPVPVPVLEQQCCSLPPRTGTEPRGNVHRARVAAAARSPRLPWETSGAAQNENWSRSINSLLFFGENPGKK